MRFFVFIPEKILSQIEKIANPFELSVKTLSFDTVVLSLDTN